MRAAVAYETGRPLEIVEMEPTALGELDVQVRMGAAGLCHSDVSVQEGALPWPLPMILGHEGAGIVERTGARVTHVAPGDHVAMSAILNCGRCRYCMNGTPTLCSWGGPYMFESLAPDGPERARDERGRGLRQMCCLGTIAEQVIIPGNAAIKIPDDVPFAVAAIAGCAVSTGLGAVFRRARVHPGSTVAVIGCGGVGLNVVQGARIAGAAMIIAIDPVASKREFAGRFGATQLLDPADGDVVEQVRDLTEGVGVDYVIESVGSAQVVHQAWEMAGADGTIVVLGVPDPSVHTSINVQSIALGHKTLTGALYGGGRPQQDIPRYLQMYRSGALKVDELITQTYDITKVNDAIADLHEGRNAKGVILLD
ncbi:MAG TPA: Zn-dependent alcohol dehydrogenase [Pseudonocardia sp.]|nr:Zn-dependent alcohol dehydrogenase [Pseudonocardia sp.]